MSEFGFCEGWIETKLRQRLGQYKAQYPNFKLERFVRIVSLWDDRHQRRSPYIEDSEIKRALKALRCRGKDSPEWKYLNGWIARDELDDARKTRREFCDSAKKRHQEKKASTP